MGHACRAQQRFRERQRQKSLESHAQLEQLSQEVAQYKARATAAEDRYQLLERVMAMRQEEIPEKKLSGDLKDVQVQQNPNYSSRYPIGQHP